MPGKRAQKVERSKTKSARIFLGTSGWHYDHWNGVFYPPEIKGYNELRFYSERFDSVENNSSFYRIAKESTYKTWARMVPEDFRFSLKLNRSVTHTHRLKLTPETMETVRYILSSLQVLGKKLGAMVIQLPASFKCDLDRMDAFLSFIISEAKKLPHAPDFAAEFRSPTWFNEDTYALLKKHCVALVAADSSRYPRVREVTANIAYIRFHGPEQLFASSYSHEQLTEWAQYIQKIAKKTKRVYIYFNNDINGHALANSRDLKALLEL